MACTRRATASGFLVAIAVGIACHPSPVEAARAPQSCDERQPRNIYELIRSFDHTFRRILTPEDYDEYRLRSPRQVEKEYPELYARISQDVKAWTDLWIHHVRTDLVPISDKRMEKAHDMAEHVSSVMKTHFEERGWTFRPLDVVFLPPQVFLDEAHRGNLTSGMYIPFYPDSIFVSVDWPIPIELTLAHEILHYNQTGDTFGHFLEEGLADIGARYIVVKYDILTEYSLRRVGTYPDERKGVEVVLEEIEKRTGKSRDEAIDLFLEALLTGKQDRMNGLFGAERWTRVIGLSHEGWRDDKIREALGG